MKIFCTFFNSHLLNFFGLVMGVVLCKLDERWYRGDFCFDQNYRNEIAMIPKTKMKAVLQNQTETIRMSIIR